MYLFILAVVLTIAVIVFVLFTTPKNLRGYYGKKFILIPIPLILFALIYFYIN